MNHHARETLIARSVSDDSHQYQVNAAWADIRNRTSHVLPDLLRRIAELEAEVKTLRTRAVPFTTLSKEKLGYFFLDGLMFDMTVPEKPVGRIGDKNVTIMGLNNDERTSINRIIQDTYVRMAGEIAKLKPVLERSGDGYRMEVSGPIPDSMAIKQEFQRRATEVLGPERFTIWHLSAEYFFHFGARDATFFFTPRKYPWGDSWDWYRGENNAGSGLPLHRCIEHMTSSPLCGLIYLYPHLPKSFVAELLEAARKELAWDLEEAERMIKKQEERLSPPLEAVNNF